MFMRRFSALGLCTLATAALLWSAMPAAAQHHGGGGHGGGHVGGGRVGGHYGGGWGGHYGGRGYYGGWGRHYGWGWGGFGLGLALGYPGWGGYYGWGYPSYSYYAYPSYGYYNDYYAQPYIYSTPSYSYPWYDTYGYSSPSLPATTYEGAEESSMANESPNSAMVDVRVPNPNAQIWIEGQKTNQQGTFRQFVSPPLDPNRDYTYHVRAQWQQNGHEVDQTRDVAVHAGDRITIDFHNTNAQQPSTASTQHLNQTPRSATSTNADTNNATNANTNNPPAPAQPVNPAPGTSSAANSSGTTSPAPAQPTTKTNQGPAVP